MTIKSTSSNSSLAFIYTLRFFTAPWGCPSWK